MAIKGQGSILSVATAAGSPKTITAASVANPVVITSSAHGLANGTIVLIAGIVGMTQLNNRAFVVANTATNTFELKGEDGTSYTAYTSGGTATSQTMTALSQPTQIQGFDGQASEIDVTHLQSAAKEFNLGLEDFGNVTLKVWLVNSDTGQIKLRSLKSSATSAVYTLQLSDSTVAAFVAFVKQFSFDGVQPDGAVSGNVTLRVTNRPAWFA